MQRMNFFSSLERGYYRNIIVHFLSLGQFEQFASQYPTRWWSSRYIFEATSSKFLMETHKVRIADDTQTVRNRDPVLFVDNRNQLLIEYQLYLSGSPNDLVVILSHPKHTCRMSYEDG